LNRKYSSAREAFGEGRLSWTKDDIVGYLIAPSYRFSDSHSSVTNLAGAVAAGPVALTERAIAAGYASSGRLTFEDVEGDVAAVVLARRGGVLIAFLDEVEGLPRRLAARADLTIGAPKKSAPLFYFRV